MLTVGARLKLGFPQNNYCNLHPIELMNELFFRRENPAYHHGIGTLIPISPT
jgi:hypothetical protein